MGWLGNLTKKVSKAVSGVCVSVKSKASNVVSEAYNSVKPKVHSFRGMRESSVVNDTKPLEPVIADGDWHREREKHIEGFSRTPETLPAQAYDERPNHSRSAENLSGKFMDLEVMLNCGERGKVKGLISESLKEIMYCNFDGKDDASLLDSFGDGVIYKLTKNYNRKVREEGQLEEYNLLWQKDKKALMTLEVLAKMRAAHLRSGSKKSFEEYLENVIENESNYVEATDNKSIYVLRGQDEREGKIEYKKENGDEDIAFVTEYGTIHKSILNEILSTDMKAELNYYVTRQRMSKQSALADISSAKHAVRRASGAK